MVFSRLAVNASQRHFLGRALREQQFILDPKQTNAHGNALFCKLAGSLRRAEEVRILRGAIRKRGDSRHAVALREGRLASQMGSSSPQNAATSTLEACAPRN